MNDTVELYNEEFDLYVASSDAEIVAIIQELLEELEDGEEYEYDEDGVAYWYDEEEDVFRYYDEEDDEWYVWDEDEEDE